MTVYKNMPLSDYTVLPSSKILAILDNSFVSMWLILVIVCIVLIVTLKYLWALHEVPAHKAKKTGVQTKLVVYLTLIGLIVHEVWLLAFIIAFIDWEKVENALVRIIQRANKTYNPEEWKQLEQQKAKAEDENNFIRETIVEELTEDLDSDETLANDVFFRKGVFNRFRRPKKNSNVSNEKIVNTKNIDKKNDNGEK